MSQTHFQTLPSEALHLDNSESPHKESFDRLIQKENEQACKSSHELSQASTQPEEPSFPIQEPLETRITVPIEATSPRPSISRANRANKLAVQASFLRRVCAVLVSLTVWTVFTSSEVETGNMLETTCIIAFCCFGYFTFENLYVCVTVEDSQENLFNILDGLFTMYFVCVLNFQNEDNLIRVILISSPCLFLLSLCLYLWKSQAKKREKIIIRLSYTIQASLIIAKVIGFVAFTWMEVLIPSRVCLLGHQAYGLYTIIASLGKMIKQRNHFEINGLSFVKNCLSMSWHLLYYGLSSLALGILLDLCMQVEEEVETVSVGIFAEIAQYYCSFFFGYTFIFIKLMKMLNINMNENVGQLQIRSVKEEERYSLKPQKKSKISHFMKVSATYFVKIDKEKSQEIDSNRSEIEETLCYICETNQPNMILIGCGHGGMCKDCLLASMKKNNKCLQCRTPVQSIYQIKKENEGSRGVVEAYKTFCVH